MEEIINKLINSNLKLVSRDTNIPYDRMFKWKQGKGKPKKEDYDTLVEYFNNGTKSIDKLHNQPSSDIKRLENEILRLEDIIEDLRADKAMLIKDKNMLQSEKEELKERLNAYENKSKTGTN